MRKILGPSRPFFWIKRSIVLTLSGSILGWAALLPHSSASNSTPQPGSSASGVGQNTAPQQQDKNGCPNCSPPGNQVIYIPLIDLPEARGSELVFNSRSPKEMDVTPTFYKLDGTTVAGDPVRVKSAEIRYVDLKRLIPAQHRNERDWGGLSLSFYGVNREMWAQLRFLHVNGGSSVDEFFIVKDEPRSEVQEAAWWMPGKSTAVIALGNVTDAPTGAVVRFGDGDTQTVTLAPHATEIVRRERAGNEGAESVTINITGAPGSVIPTGVIASKHGSFNSVIRFYDTRRAKQPHLFANGLRLAGAAPHMILKNTSSSPITAQPKFIPPEGVAAAEPVIVPEIGLGPGEATAVDLTLLLAAVRSRRDLDVVSVEVGNSGAPGSLIGSLYGVNATTGVVYDIPLRDSGPVRTMTGSYPWRIDKDYTTVVYVTNISDQEAEFVSQINYDGGKFVIDPRKLKPGETATFDLQKIRDERMPDNTGRSLPKTASLGQFKWAVRGVTGGKLVLIGRAEMVSRSQRISTSYSCNDPCPPVYFLTIDGFEPIFALSQSSTFTIWEGAMYGSGYTTGPFSSSAECSFDNPIASLYSPNYWHTVTMTGINAGDGFMHAFSRMEESYYWDGLNCYDSYTQYEVGTTQPVTVLPTITVGAVSLNRTTISPAVNATLSITLTASSGLTVTSNDNVTLQVGISNASRPFQLGFSPSVHPVTLSPGQSQTYNFTVSVMQAPTLSATCNLTAIVSNPTTIAVLNNNAPSGQLIVNP